MFMTSEIGEESFNPIYHLQCNLKSLLFFRVWVLHAFFLHKSITSPLAKLPLYMWFN